MCKRRMLEICPTVTVCFARERRLQFETGYTCIRMRHVITQKEKIKKMQNSLDSSVNKFTKVWVALSSSRLENPEQY